MCILSKSKLHNLNEVDMIGESKLWKFDKNKQDWEIFKLFSPKASVFARITWLEIVQDDFPQEEFKLSQHHPNKSVGE